MASMRRICKSNTDLTHMHTMNRERVVFVLAVLHHVVWVGSTTHKGVTDPGAVRGILRRVWVVYVVTCSGQ